jgi:hypothetical protein
MADIVVRRAGAESGTIQNGPGNYHGPALAGVDTQIRLSNVGDGSGKGGAGLGPTILVRWAKPEQAAHRQQFYSSCPSKTKE